MLGIFALVREETKTRSWVGQLLGLVVVEYIILAFLCIGVSHGTCSSGEGQLLANLGSSSTGSETNNTAVHGCIWMWRRVRE
ncbi:hypothetical protein BDB00DRAFT_812168 [Zychaea mexicana]|uniref:uncharacterized protein n=1 Tax=Zychaea mexicana TaxID=64656 RepID=UPI0022FF35A3|nr:uncharacterized protein BDB00DRAFT_812168 [Zychaea mexicana]KAI9495844.1 hypothetical protein BDB00DRAFT_812168 [Zychaea mexicana]